MGKVYKVSLPFLLFNYTVLVALSVGAIFLFFAVFLNPAQKARLFAGVSSCFVIVFALPYGLQLPHTICMDEPGRLVFRSLLLQRTFEVSDLKSIKTGLGNGYFLYFEFKRGRVAVLNSVKNLSELVNIIKSINPEVLTRGCWPLRLHPENKGWNLCFQAIAVIMSNTQVLLFPLRYTADPQAVD